MSTGDSTLMMLLSLNLLLLVFFMMLNSMATYGKRHADEVMAQVRQGYNLPGKGAMRDSQAVPEVALEAWRAGMVARLQGVVINRIDLITPPQQGSASKIEMVLPASALFDTDGKLVRPETVRNIAAAAGVESRVVWQVAGNWKDPRVAAMVAQLALQTDGAEMVYGRENVIRVTVMPGFATKPEMGVKVQQMGESVGAAVRGIDSRSVTGRPTGE